MKDILDTLVAIEAAMTAELAKNTGAKGKALPHLQDAQVRVRTAIRALRRHVGTPAAPVKPEKPEKTKA